jgi:hypothetical protein
MDKSQADERDKNGPPAEAVCPTDDASHNADNPEKYYACRSRECQSGLSRRTLIAYRTDDDLTNRLPVQRCPGKLIWWSQAISRVSCNADVLSGFLFRSFISQNISCSSNRLSRCAGKSCKERDPKYLDKDKGLHYKPSN